MNSRPDFPLLRRIQTRWSDYDQLGHVNNVQFYRYFEFIILDHLADLGLDWQKDPVIAMVVESHCNFRRPVPVARQIEAGLRVAHLGNTSLRYDIALFECGAEEPSADGYFVHVYVDRNSGRPEPIPEYLREGFAAIGGADRSDRSGRSDRSARSSNPPTPAD